MNTQRVHGIDIKFRKLQEVSSILTRPGFNRLALQPVILFLILLFLWFLMPVWLHRVDETVGSIDQGIWLLIILSLICLLLVLSICWWLLQHAWLKLGLPSIQKMVSQFNTLSSWQQLGFYWASFALVLLAALLTLIAIC